MMRLAIVLAAVPVALVLYLESGSIAPPLIVAVLTALTVLMPGSAGAALLIGYAALAMAFGGRHPVRLGVLVMIPALHLIHVTSALAAVVPVKTRIDPAALERTGAPVRHCPSDHIRCRGRRGGGSVGCEHGPRGSARTGGSDGRDRSRRAEDLNRLSQQELVELGSSRRSVAIVVGVTGRR